MGKIEDAAKADLRAAQSKLAGVASRHDLETRATHFIGDRVRGYKLRNDSPEHGNTLTADEYAAVKALVEGKKLAKDAVDQHNRFADGGQLSTAQDVARVAAS